ncbi:MAG: hypothetical protein O7F70_09530 [Gemmatimonadetes bacterium]|nr:hypothetical protein [Gemmatimonadota bacterium]
MKDWHFRIPTAIGGLLALVVLWGEFGHTMGLPSWKAESSGSAGPRQHEFRWQRVLDAGKTIEIKGINGSVTAEKASGNRVEIIAVKVGKRSDPREVKIEVVESAEGVTVCAVYPGSSPCGSGSRGRTNIRNNDVQVRFNVRVPEGVRLVATTVNGSVKASALESDLVARTVNGSITLSTTGRAEASTVNGTIIAEIGATNLSADLVFSTVNGSISIEVPEGLNADIGASTVGGRLSSDFPLMIDRRRMHGTLGSGGYELKLSTVNGTIRLKRAR